MGTNVRPLEGGLTAGPPSPPFRRLVVKENFAPLLPPVKGHHPPNGGSRGVDDGALASKPPWVKGLPGGAVERAACAWAGSRLEVCKRKSRPSGCRPAMLDFVVTLWPRGPEGLENEPGVHGVGDAVVDAQGRRQSTARYGDTPRCLAECLGRSGASRSSGCRGDAAQLPSRLSASADLDPGSAVQSMSVCPGSAATSTRS